MGRIPPRGLLAAPERLEDTADALQKHLNYGEEQALPLLMRSFYESGSATLCPAPQGGTVVSAANRSVHFLNWPTCP